jgi:hypothetical protein
MLNLLLAVAALLVVGLLVGVARTSSGITWAERLALFGSEFGQLVFDFVDPQQLTLFAREVPTPANIGQVLGLLPAQEIDDIEAMIDRVTRTNRAAKFRAYDAESPVGKRDVFSRDRVLLPPISQKLVLGEFERLMLNRLRGAQGGQIADAIYNDTAINVRSIRARMALAVGDVLTDGVFTLADENGLTLEADFGLAGDHIVNAGTLWNAATWAQIVNDLRTWVQKVVDDSGTTPAVARTSNRVVSQVVRAAQAANAAGASFGLITRDNVNTALASDGLPTFEVVEAVVDVDGTSTRAIPDDRVILGPADMRDVGYTPYGITAEGLELAEAQRVGLDDAPGIVAVVMKEGDPVRIWTKAAAVGMPVLENPDRMLVADVL